MSDAIDRREFARSLTVGAVAAGVGGALPAAAEDEPAKAPSLPDLVLARIREEFPSDRYDAAAIEGILQDIRGDLARGRELSAFPLQNGDEPATVFPADPRSRLVRPAPEAR